MTRPITPIASFERPAYRRRSVMLWFLFVLFAALTLGACGDEPSTSSGSAWRPGDDEETEAEADFSDANYDVLGVNKKWLPIKDLFDQYAKGKIETLENPLQSHLVDHLERPVIERKRSTSIAGITDLDEHAGTPKGPPDPRTKSSLDKYKLIILMTGLSRPKAVIMMNKHRFVLERGDPIGNEGGRIKAILQYKMLVSVPGESSPRVISIEPDLGFIDSEDSSKAPSKDS
jgi:hypothetical protein